MRRRRASGPVPGGRGGNDGWIGFVPKGAILVLAAGEADGPIREAWGRPGTTYLEDTTCDWSRCVAPMPKKWPPEVLQGNGGDGEFVAKVRNQGLGAL